MVSESLVKDGNNISENEAKMYKEIFASITSKPDKIQDDIYKSDLSSDDSDHSEQQSF
jgi:hypothetical protein